MTTSFDCCAVPELRCLQSRHGCSPCPALQLYHSCSVCIHATRTGQSQLLRRCSSVGRAAAATHDTHGLHAESKYWSYDGVDVHYAIERAPGANAVVVFGPGFGAGAFQFEDVCRHVADGGVDAIAMDWLGQGKSWPEGDMAGRNFGVETWISQLTAFVEQLDYSQVYVAGNSIGGLVAASVAARSDCVKGCALLNPTPFWSFWGVNGCPLWNGDLPGPAPFEAFGGAWFDALRDEKTVQSLLRQVYASPSRADQQLARDICTSASHPNGPARVRFHIICGTGKRRVR